MYYNRNFFNFVWLEPKLLKSYRTGWYLSYEYSIRYTKPPWNVSVKISAYINLIQVYHAKYSDSASKFILIMYTKQSVSPPHVVVAIAFFSLDLSSFCCLHLQNLSLRHTSFINWCSLKNLVGDSLIDVFGLAFGGGGYGE